MINNIPLQENLSGRVRNISLAPSPDNALMPLFEAISNAFHSVNERYEKQWAEKGKIIVTISRDSEKNPDAFVVEDNGRGLNTDNFESFCKCDSEYKLKKGGRGIGRLSWLKIFDKTRVDSIYEQNGGKRRRAFNFILDNDAAIQGYEDSDAGTEPQRTVIHLQGFKNEYKSRCPKKHETIVSKTISHFLHYCLAANNLDFTINDADQDAVNLPEYFSNNTKEHESQTFSLQSLPSIEFTIQHILIHKSLADDNSPSNNIYFGANDRVVVSHKIDNQVGFDKIKSEYLYVGYVSSDLLDSRVNQERTHFDFDLGVFDEIKEKAVEEAKLYLKPYIDEVRAKQRTIFERLITEEPQFNAAIRDPADFITNKIKLNAGEEEIYIEMSRQGFRRERSIKNAIKAITNAKLTEEVIKEKIDEVLKDAGETELYSLAQYVAKRKVIIDLLQKRLAYKDTENEKHHLEKSVHEIICPLRATADDMTYLNHNLWLIDDRLAYYTFFASDKPLSSISPDTDSAQRPDVILFNKNLFYWRDSTRSPAVIVEFKKPSREDYSEQENPVSQLYEYIAGLRQKRIHAPNGELITNIDDTTPFICYIIADPTPNLNKFLDLAQIDIPTQDGGRIGFNKTMRAFIEVIPFRKLIDDAQKRNEAFFKALSLKK